MSRAVSLAGSGLFAALCVAVVALSWRSPTLKLTLRHQFDGWHDLLEVFRSPSSVSSAGGRSGLRRDALRAAWCNATLPLGTVRAPFCGCVAKAADFLANSTSSESDPLPSSAKTDAVAKLVACMSSRPVWRVWDFWAVRFTTPCLYALFVASCFFLVHANLKWAYTTFLVFMFGGVIFVAISVADYVHNVFWGFTLLAVALLVTWVLVPGISQTSDDDGADRTLSCFWWAEYLTAPAVALYVPLMHCGRDFVFTSVFTMIATGVGGLGLRSFWCAHVYRDEKQGEKVRGQFRLVMQNAVWLGILASCASLATFTGIYYNPDAPYAMGPASVVLLILTMVISLLQWPSDDPSVQARYMLPTQLALAGARNLLCFCVVLYDVLA
jgi:hypothetical protein